MSRGLIAIAICCITVQLLAVGLIAARVISAGIGIPIIMLGMFGTLVPMFVNARRQSK